MFQLGVVAPGPNSSNRCANLAGPAKLVGPADLDVFRPQVPFAVPPCAPCSTVLDAKREEDMGWNIVDHTKLYKWDMISK